MINNQNKICCEDKKLEKKNEYSVFSVNCAMIEEFPAYERRGNPKTVEL